MTVLQKSTNIKASVQNNLLTNLGKCTHNPSSFKLLVNKSSSKLLASKCKSHKLDTALCYVKSQDKSIIILQYF